MTRRAKEQRTMRVQAKQQRLEENMLREKRLSSRPTWIQLLLAIDGPSLTTSSSSLHGFMSKSPIKSSIVNKLQWKSLQVPIAASGGFQLPIKLDASKGELLYSFSTRNYDVNFGVQMISADGDLIELLGTRRYESHKEQVQGRLSLTGPGMVLLLWDNSFSWVNSKQLAYNVELKQDTLPMSDAKRMQLALDARLKRDQKLLQCEGEYDKLETQVQTEAQTIELLHHQIEELQAQLRQHEESKETIMKKKDQVGEQIDDLTWELQALSWRCLDQTVLHRILDYLDQKDLFAWLLTNKMCCDFARAYQARKSSVDSDGCDVA
ncbi:unnamed protein product [Peronospora belbahrii]|uniref:GOLD domain-containing protein n=1 Tax=Peronospora belbahrii TaxID=622444 RepID=A0AAU9KQV7_9STRA|nr:unnamed protein product [Peronospora belbahrii]CAH0513719.1 unnamed protein product [Peronospora belbahrii]